MNNYPALYNQYIQFTSSTGIRYGDTSACHLINYLRYTPHKCAYLFRAGKHTAHRLVFLEPSALPDRFGKYKKSDILAKILYDSDTKCSSVEIYREDIYRGMHSDTRKETSNGSH